MEGPVLLSGERSVRLKVLLAPAGLSLASAPEGRSARAVVMMPLLPDTAVRGGERLCHVAPGSLGVGGGEGVPQQASRPCRRGWGGGAQLIPGGQP